MDILYSLITAITKSSSLLKHRYHHYICRTCYQRHYYTTITYYDKVIGSYVVLHTIS